MWKYVILVTSRWRYDYGGTLIYQCIRLNNLIKHLKYGPDWTKIREVITFWILMAKHQTWQCRSTQALRWKLTIFVTELHQSLKSISVQVSCKYLHFSVRNTCTYKTCHFLLPAGGILTFSKYLHMDVFRTTQLTCSTSFGQIGSCTVKLQPTSCFMAKPQDLAPRHAHKV